MWKKTHLFTVAAAQSAAALPHKIKPGNWCL
jgi:hypothetical protein